jgi:hypothetical protein
MKAPARHLHPKLGREQLALPGPRIRFDGIAFIKSTRVSDDSEGRK